MSTNDLEHENRASAPFVSYGFTVLLVAVAAAIRWGLGHAFGPFPPFLTFYPALMLAALIGGLGPGLAATGLGGFAALYLFIPPIHSAGITNLGDGIALAIFCIIGASISVVTDQLHTARAKQVRQQSEERYRSLFNRMTEGFALHEIICDKKGEPSDYRFLELNPAFERLTGLKGRDLLGKTVKEVMPGTERYWIETFGKVALSGEPVHFENFSSALEKHYEVFAYSPAPRQFAVMFTDVTERKKAEIGLQESEQRWATTLASIGDAVIATDAAGRITFMNAVAEELTGWTLPEASTKPSTEVFNIINEHTRDEVESPIIKVFKEGTIVGLANHTVLVRKDGTEVPIDDSGAPIRHADGETMGVVLVFRDITERKRAEGDRERLHGELAMEKARWQATVENLLDPVTVCDAEGRATYMNRAYQQLIERPIAQDLGMEAHPDYYQLYRPDGTLFPAEELPLQKAARTGENVRDVELIQRSTGGREFTAIFSAAPLRDAEGNVTGAVAVGRDITERKRMEEELREARDELEVRVQERTENLRRQADLLELAHSAILVRDMEGRVTFWNARAEEVYGWTKAEALGKVIHTFLNAQFPQPFDEYTAVLAKEGRWQSDLVHATKDGRQITVLSRQALQRDEAGIPLAIMEIDLDVTEARRTEQQLRQAQKVEAIGTLTGGIAHDFNNILAAMIGFTELAKGRALKGSRQEEHLQRVLGAGLRGRDLVKQLLTFSRKTEQEKETLQLSSIVRETMELLRASIPSTISTKVKIDSESGSGLVFADPTQMQQTLMNLCTNAAHAMREKGGILDVELSDSFVSANGEDDRIKPGLYMKLLVRDTGVGMPPEIVDKIFDPFFTTKKQGEGTGLGLSVVHGIVKQHDGYLTVESEPGKGSTFAVYLPKVLEEAPSQTAREDAIPNGCERVLLVDDEELLAEMGQELLEELGYKVTIRASSTDALATLKADPTAYDLVITDQTMPEMTGVDLAREVLALRSDMPIILCTGFSHLVDADQAKAAGIRAFAMKPLTKREIAKTVRMVLDATG